MIHDTLNSTTTLWLQQCYPVLREAFDWIRALSGTPTHGITELHGSMMYVNIHGYDTLPISQCNWESHRHTIDLQYCITGGEVIDWLPEGKLEPFGEYNANKDTQTWNDSIIYCSHVLMLPGTYTIFLPNEFHRPKVSDGCNHHVNKLVVKIHNDLFTGIFK